MRFSLLVAVTAVVALATAPTQPGAWSVVVALLVIVSVGIPHGAADHLVAVSASPRPDEDMRRRSRRADLWYVAAIATYAVVWLAAPGVALAVFLLMSVHHFGQSDLARLRLPTPWQLAVQWTRGVVVIGVPLVLHLDDAAPVLETLGAGDVTRWSSVLDHRMAVAAALVTLHALCLVTAARANAGTWLARELASLALLTLLFTIADPLVGFAVYFGLWHSLPHLAAVGRFLGTSATDRPGIALARLAAPRTAISLAALAVMCVGAALTGRTDLVLPAAIVLLSLLTLPHLVVVERMWRAGVSPQ